MSKWLIIPDILSLGDGVARGVWGVWVSLLGSQSPLWAAWNPAWLLALAGFIAARPWPTAGQGWDPHAPLCP